MKIGTLLGYFRMGWQHVAFVLQHENSPPGNKGQGAEIRFDQAQLEHIPTSNEKAAVIISLVCASCSGYREVGVMGPKGEKEPEP